MHKIARIYQVEELALVLILLVQDTQHPHLPLLATDQKWEYDGELSYGIAVLAQIARSIGG